MTFSREQRLDNINLALRLMMQDLGEKRINGTLFHIEEPPYQDIYPTSWQYLENCDLITPFIMPRGKWYVLTGSGWLKGLEVTGNLKSPELFTKMCGIMSALKRRVKDRKDRAFAYSVVIATEAAVSHEFLTNILESDYIQNVLNRKGVRTQRSSHGYRIEIPVDFDIPLDIGVEDI